MRWGIGLCVAGSQGKQVRVSLGEAWVITVQKEQTRQSREVGGTGDGSEGRCWAGSLGLIRGWWGPQGPCVEGGLWGSVGAWLPLHSLGVSGWVGVLSSGGVFRLHRSGHISWGHGDLLRFCESPRAGGRGLPW